MTVPAVALGVFLIVVVVAVLVGTIALSRTRSGQAALPGHSVSESAFWNDFAEVRARLRRRRPCQHPGCVRKDGWLCAFGDSGGHCKVILCDDHVLMVENMPFCAHHAAVIHQQRHAEELARRAQETGTREDLVVQLLKEICRRVEPGLLAILSEMTQDKPELTISAEGGVGEAWEGIRRLGWQRTWGVHNVGGYVLRVIVRVGTDEPPTASALVNKQICLSRVPDWIAAQVAGRAPTVDDYSRFEADLLAGVRAAITGQLAPLGS